MTEVEELIKQAEKIKGEYRKSRVDAPPVSNLTWQELLDGKQSPQLRYGKL